MAPHATENVASRDACKHVITDVITINEYVASFLSVSVKSKQVKIDAKHVSNP